MIDFITPQPGLPIYHWHGFRKPGPDVDAWVTASEEGNWPAETRLQLAHFIGWQYVDQGESGWMVKVYDEDCDENCEPLIWTAPLHHEWVESLATDDPELLAIKAAMRNRDRGLTAVYAPPGLLEALSGLARTVSTPANEWEALRPGRRNDLADSLRRFETMLNDAGEPDVDKALEVIGASLVTAMRIALEHNRLNHKGQPWSACPEQAALVARVASTFAAAWVAAATE